VVGATGRQRYIHWINLIVSYLNSDFMAAERLMHDDAHYLQDGRSGTPSRRSSRHQSKNRPIFFARSRSSLVLKPLTVFAITESLSSIFHLDTTRWEKKYFRISLLHRHLTSFNECPRVLPVVSIWNISVNGIASLLSYVHYWKRERERDSDNGTRVRLMGFSLTHYVYHCQRRSRIGTMQFITCGFNLLYCKLTQELVPLYVALRV